MRGDKENALTHYQEGVTLFEKLGAQTLVEQVKQLIASLEGGAQQEQGMTPEQFIAGAIQSAREKRPDAEQYFNAAQKMAVDSSAPREVQELGKVLKQIMAGMKDVDLSGLPEEWREMVERAVHE